MAIVLEIIGAFILASAIGLLIFHLNTNAYETVYENQLTYNQQYAAELFRQEVRNDIRMAGYNITDLRHTIQTARTDELVFLTDIDENDRPDTLRIFTRYYGDPSSFVEDPTPDNPLDFQVVRDFRGREHVYEYQGITRFEFEYLNNEGEATTNPSKVKIIQFNFTITAPKPVDTEKDSLWVGNFAPAIGTERVFLKNAWEW